MLSTDRCNVNQGIWQKTGVTGVWVPPTHWNTEPGITRAQGSWVWDSSCHERTEPWDLAFRRRSKIAWFSLCDPGQLWDFVFWDCSELCTRMNLLRHNVLVHAVFSWHQMLARLTFIAGQQREWGQMTPQWYFDPFLISVVQNQHDREDYGRSLRPLITVVTRCLSM